MGNRIQSSLQAATREPPRMPEGTDTGDTRRGGRPIDTIAASPAPGAADLLREAGLPVGGNGKGNNTMRREAARELATEGAKQLLELATDAAVGVAVGAIYALDDGLRNIGKATSDGRRQAEQRAFVAGMVNTLYPGMDDATMSPDAARKIARGGNEYTSTLREIYDYQPGSHTTKFEHLKRRVAQYERGMREGRRLLASMKPGQRRAALRSLREELVAANPLYAGWAEADTKQAIQEMLMLRIK